MGLLDRFRSRSEDPVAGDRWLVVGLGNPEAEYGGTRHNVGADTVRLLAGQLGAAFKPHKVQAQVADGWDRPGGTPLSLVLPFGYMNLSGGPVQQAMAFYKVPHERLVVVHDDLDLPLAEVRIKRGGGNGGHNGLKDVTRRTASPEYVRVRIGIGRPPGRQDPADYVLKRFGAKDRELVDVAVATAADAVLAVVADGVEAAQNRYHAPSSR
jgi:peptidyl-tRNA hydrolase, PTH1 family